MGCNVYLKSFQGLHFQSCSVNGTLKHMWYFIFVITQPFNGKGTVSASNQHLVGKNPMKKESKVAVLFTCALFASFTNVYK